MNNFDIGIIGAGVAGSFATFKIANDYPDAKTIVFDLGRPPMKRRRQLEGWLGCLPNSDGKLFLNDITKVSEIVGDRKTKKAYTAVKNILSNINDLSVIKDKAPLNSLEKKLKKSGYDISLNNYIQMYPKDIHALSKYMAGSIEENNNITFSFDNEVKRISKHRGSFIIATDYREFKCKKLLIAVGRGGWRFAEQIFNNFGIIDSNDIAKFGIRVEINSAHMKDFNKSNCTLTKGNEIEIGPLSWFGTVIPEDHVDLAISAFRANENRWTTDKVSFSLIGNREFPNKGFEQTDRLGKLTFILANDRIIKERISYILSGKSKISILKEYDWLKEAIQDFAQIVPEIISKGYFHVPTIMPLAPRINLGNNLESEIENMFVVGESAGVSGILSAATMGIIAAEQICK